MNTFSGGIHPPSNKKFSKNSPIDKGFRPSFVVLPLLQHIGAECTSLVKKGDEVTAGQRLAESDQFVSSPVHASVSGKVLAVEPRLHPCLGKVQSVVIEVQEEQKKWQEKTKDEIAKISIENLKAKIKEGGIVGLGGAAFPAFIKLSPPKDKKIDTLIINGAECEPYLTSDYRMMLEEPAGIIKGIRLLAKVLDVENIFIGIEENKPDAIEQLNQELQLLNEKNIKVCSLQEKYPQGGEKQLISAIAKRKVPSGKLPMDVGVCVHNVSTAFAVYELIYKDKPLIERVVSVTGDMIAEPKNILVPMGSLYKDLVDYCGGLTGEAEKVIMGGPMMGFAQYSLDVPVIKGTSGIIFNKKDESASDKDYPCINCGRCVSVCPMKLMPAKLCGLVEKEIYIELETNKIFDCMECGACAYICPAKKPIVHRIRQGKTVVKKI